MGTPITTQEQGLGLQGQVTMSDDDDSTSTVPTMAFQNLLQNGLLVPAGSQGDHDQWLDPDAQLAEFEVPTWGGADLNADGFHHPTYSNVFPQNGLQNGMVGTHLPGEEPFTPAALMPPPHDQRTPLHYLIPGGNNFPYALEANWRNLHAHEFLVALSQEQMRYPTRAPLHAMGLRRALQRTSTTILSSQLNGDHYDFQGLAWTFMGISRKKARCRRFDTYENHVNQLGADTIQVQSSMI